MLNDITIGQYFPLESAVHRCDPRSKLLLTIGFIASSFICQSFLSIAALGGLLIVLVLLSRVPVRMFFKGLKSILPLMLFASVLNIFYGTGTVLAEWWVFKITVEGLLRAGIMTARILLLIVASSLLTYTTSPTELTDGLERLFSPLRLIGLGTAVHLMAMMMTLALRFIPTLIEETERLMNAQKARGASMDSGGLLKRVRAMLPILIPLLISAFRRAADLAEAMECRCYNGGHGRTRMKRLRFGLVDLYGLLLMAAVCGGAIVLSVWRN